MTRTISFNEIKKVRVELHNLFDSKIFDFSDVETVATDGEVFTICFEHYDIVYHLTKINRIKIESNNGKEMVYVNGEFGCFQL